MSEPEATTSGAVFTRDLQVTRCRQCSRTLCKTTPNALRSGQMVEIKCGACNVMNYLLGRLEAGA